ncbi:SH3 domain-containing protein [Duganella fentianensis]|uniref:SH3 domain-containing protein n=1 Tax=Duganella fentianensis TaxID=2692177 RepID=UPI0032B2A63C
MHHAVLPVAVYAAALLLTLVLAAYCTPRNWWRQLNLRAIAITLGGTLLFGQLLWHWLPAAAGRAATPEHFSPVRFAPAQASATQTGGAPPASGRSDCCAALTSAQAYTVHRSINLRRAASIRAERMRTIPAGTLVTPTGTRHGDWWQITACSAGRCDTGWVSSLWLRRSEEHQGHAP